MIYEAEFASGLSAVVREEINACIGLDGHIIGMIREDALQFTFEGNHIKLLTLKTVVAVYLVLQFDIPRPKALLGHQHFHLLLHRIQTYLDLHDYQTLYLGAAGSSSSVMMRIKSELSKSLNLRVSEDEGDLLLRIRRTPQTRQGWDVLIRLSSRPLATRNWRVCNYEGALNASVAMAILHLTDPTPTDSFLNIACGSGTILIERQELMSAHLLIGCDIAVTALDCAKANIRQAGVTQINLLHTDAIQLPIATASVNKLVADLPFGQLTGSHDENEWLYPAILAESARVAVQGARFVIITHEVRLMEHILQDNHDWRLMEPPQKVVLSGLHPRIYLLERL
ncbi:MAG: methyltransferase domain-containing protein [Anaerolineae bacterium]